MGKTLATASIKSAFEIMKNKIKRNPRLAVPQYYDGNNVSTSNKNTSGWRQDNNNGVSG